MKLNNLKLFNIATIFRSPVFWFAVLVDYMIKLGLTESSVFNIIAWYSIVVVATELPTGVIGDRYSHKLSVILGSLLTGISIMGLYFNLDLWIYYILLTGAGIGTSLISGSDVALLHSISKKFDTDYKNNKIMATVTQLAGITSGAFLYVYNNKLPIMLTSIFFILSAIITIFIKTDNSKAYNPKTQHVSQELVNIKKEIFSSRKLQNIITIITITSGFFLSFKWFFNPLYVIWGVPLAWYGIITGLSVLFKVIGVWASKKVKIKPLYIILITGGILACVVSISQSFMALLFMYLSFTAYGYLDAEMIVSLNNTIKNNNRAALNSLTSLFTRLFSSAILVYSGFISRYAEIQFSIFIIIGTLYMLSIIVYFYLRINKDFTNPKLKNI